MNESWIFIEARNANNSDPIEFPFLSLRLDSYKRKFWLLLTTRHTEGGNSRKKKSEKADETLWQLHFTCTFDFWETNYLHLIETFWSKLFTLRILFHSTTNCVFAWKILFTKKKKKNSLNGIKKYFCKYFATESERFWEEDLIRLQERLMKVSSTNCQKHSSIKYCLYWNFHSLILNKKRRNI